LRLGAFRHAINIKQGLGARGQKEKSLKSEV
jgi:hypothetical protein